MSSALILLAGGSGSRLGGTPKQFRDLAGNPVWLWSLLRTQHLFDEVVVVADQPFHETVSHYLKKHCSAMYTIALCGKTRQESVDNGIEACSASLLLVHDAARPFINPKDAQSVLAQLQHTPTQATILADKCTATVKTLTGPLKQQVASTLNRDELALASTPQGISRAIWRRFEPKTATTDEASRAEAIGVHVNIIWTTSINPKITTAADWQYAQALADILLKQ